RYRDRVEFGQTALRRLAGAVRWLEREGEAEHCDGSSRVRGAAGDAGAHRAAADDERQPGQLACTQALDDRNPGGVELRGAGGRAPAGDAVGLLDQRDADLLGA